MSLRISILKGIANVYAAIDAFQEHVLKQGPQHNESLLEHKKDEQIANFIRGATGIKKN